MGAKKVVISEEDLRKKVQEGKTDAEIAQEVGVSVKTLRNRRREYGIEAGNRGRPSGHKDSDKRKKRDPIVKEPLYLSPSPRPVNPNRGIRDEDLPRLAPSAYEYKGNVAMLKKQYVSQPGLPKRVKVQQIIK